MNYLPSNLKHLRKQKGWTQEECAKQLGIKRGALGAYEEGRAEPKLELLKTMTQKFGVSIDELVFQAAEQEKKVNFDATGDRIRVLPIVVDRKSGKEGATIVPAKAAAGYLNGFGDQEFIGQLPVFQLPFPELTQDKTFRIFQIKGDSMLPIVSESYVICSYQEDWTSLKDEYCIVVSRNEGIVFKRVTVDQSAEALTLISDNADYEPFDLQFSEVLEIWRAEGFTQIGFGKVASNTEDGLMKQLHEIRSELAILKHKLD